MGELNQAIRNIPMPAKIGRLRVSSRGFPVPWFVQWYGDEPDFRVIAPGKMGLAHNKRLCWICGEPLGRFLAFVIGPMCAINRVSSEPPSHRECAEYAAKACPFLSNPRMRRNENDLPEEGGVAGIHIAHNPGVTLVYVAHDYRPIRDHAGGVLFELGMPVSAVFYCQGREATRAEVLAAIDKGLPFLREHAAAEGPEAVAELNHYIRRGMELVPAA
jgi:hypothetical protein